MSNELNDFEITEIKKRARARLGECRKMGDIIGTQIFPIMSLYARVIFYPLGETSPWGFTRISGSRNDAALEKPFVAINTSIPVSCQVFAAAHELYHIWYETDPDVLPVNLLEEGREISERKANRFAAEFLCDEALLRQEIEIYRIREFTLKNVLQLADLFTIPYQAMVKRLYETDYIGLKEKEDLLSLSNAAVKQHRKRYAFQSDDGDHHIAMDNLAELAGSAYDSGLISFEKLEYLLGLCNLTPEDLGVEKEADVPFPSDEELDAIMEADG